MELSCIKKRDTAVNAFLRVLLGIASVQYHKKIGKD